MQLRHEILENLQNLGNDRLFLVFIMLIFLDIVTGKSLALKSGEYNSYTGVHGLIKHVVVLLLQITVSISGNLIGYAPMGYSLCVFFIMDYMVSIYANAVLLGIHLPDIKLTEKEVEKKLKSTYGDDKNV